MASNEMHIVAVFKAKADKADEVCLSNLKKKKNNGRV